MNNMLNEKKNFIRHVLMNSPPGKLYDLVKDINILLGSSVSIQKILEEVLKDYNEKNYNFILTDKNEYVITCKKFKVNHLYFIPKLKALVHTANVLETVKELKYPEELENYRKECDKKLVDYVQEHYKKWSNLQTINYPEVHIKSPNGLRSEHCSSVYAYNEEDIFYLFFIICCDRSYLKNFHASTWRSSWTAQFFVDNDHVLLSGTIDISLTYFEDANINFKTSKCFEKKVRVNRDVDMFSSNILSAINEYENYILYDLNNFFTNINKNLIKSTRRIIPLSGQKFDWKGKYEDIPKQIRFKLLHIKKK
ncbi:hypothetical protein PFMC_01211 [Plasmodium falciparum CAMP/Malaysia]|uniref:F-actin-capping protein subunit alpha n=1 Tax=Plasmodium falciparum (isolate Camp / Malaysia) TaxID=5835 RepID=A0A024XDU6_PLAFC|nr:hypothetical protein PFMC_01211 [Plasmodium falciparum CAMP/Malaysia]